MKAFKEFLASKVKEGGPALDPKESKAKREMLDHLSGMMKNHMSDGLKKVTVASDSKEGLEKGLEKAKEIVDKAPEVSSEESAEEEPAEAEENHAEELLDEPMSAEEIDEMIKLLQEKKAKLAE